MPFKHNAGYDRRPRFPAIGGLERRVEIETLADFPKKTLIVEYSLSCQPTSLYSCLRRQSEGCWH